MIETENGRTLSVLKMQWKFYHPNGPKHYSVEARIKPGEQSGFIAYIPALPGCLSQGRTLEKAKSNIREALFACLENYIDNKSPIPWRKSKPKSPFELSFWIQFSEEAENNHV